jgi:hypothetical protein
MKGSMNDKKVMVFFIYHSPFLKCRSFLKYTRFQRNA